ncbi:hypothetical protein SO802_001620, partial [Lithocarpus litseifolius]
ITSSGEPSTNCLSDEPSTQSACLMEEKLKQKGGSDELPVLQTKVLCHCTQKSNEVRMDC